MQTIEQIMSAIDSRKFHWYENLTEEDRSKVNKKMWVFQRWISSIINDGYDIKEYYLIQINNLVNVNFNDLSKHPELQIRLMQCVGLGSTRDHHWIIPMNKKKDTSGNKKLFKHYVQLFPLMNDDEIAFMMDSPKAELKELLQQQGLDDKQIKGMLK